MTPENMTKQDAITEIGNAIYKAAFLFEQLEGKRKVHGNGHHLQQEVANFAQNLMNENWIK